MGAVMYEIADVSPNLIRLVDGVGHQNRKVI
jgi:hypothetical protein